ncbi:hypothetical protein TWF481_002571 [Arthrobotrys musiformis]|uniref:Uncharacterized protein n=1 Tax=Arthrobotrys musiformis TaxID=47236 RepID=A0AAV9VQK9_9PEZI
MAATKGRVGKQPIYYSLVGLLGSSPSFKATGRMGFRNFAERIFGAHQRKSFPPSLPTCGILTERDWRASNKGEAQEGKREWSDSDPEGLPIKKPTIEAEPKGVSESTTARMLNLLDVWER